jgi:hypothetical protein
VVLADLRSRHIVLDVNNFMQEPFGTYCLINPFRFSFDPLSQE